MHVLSLVTTAVLIAQAYTFPTGSPSEPIANDQDVLLFDGVAFSPANPATLIQKASAELQSFTFQRDIDLGPLNASVSATLSALGLSLTSDQMAVALDRLRLFAAVPISANVPVTVDHFCNVILSNPVNGTALRNVSLCGETANTVHGRKLAATVPTADGRKINAFAYSTSSPSGFGVISDIDDTVKVSNVLNTVALLKSTLLDTPVAVSGMPELYASIAKSLDAAPFIYVSASPYQIYPFLRNFIDMAFSSSNGPIFLKNLTVTSLDLSTIVHSTPQETFDYKSAMIDRIKGIYPNKKFLAVGDSTQQDPETYAAAFRRYGDFITCIWIRRVDGANNTDERFAAAFDGVPTNKYRIYNDSEIPGLQTVDIAAGEC